MGNAAFPAARALKMTPKAIRVERENMEMSLERNQSTELSEETLVVSRRLSDTKSDLFSLRLRANTCSEEKQTPKRNDRNQ